MEANNILAAGARDPHEPHRVATPLELFLDLVYVVAISAAAGGLHHLLGEHHVGSAVFSYVAAFFAIFWCWLNFTWYASAYDTRDVTYNLITFVQIFGALILAVGVGRFFAEKPDFAIPIAGYVVMRCAMALHWFRAARRDPQRRRACLIYAFGILFVQVLWVINYFIPFEYFYYGFAIIWILEAAVPVLAERSVAHGTPWHPHHIAERYSLLVIIVLGEGILAVTRNMSGLLSGDIYWVHALLLGLGAAMLMFALWWSYFVMPFGELLHRHHDHLRIPLYFGYLHFFVFAALGAVGAGLSLVAESEISGGHAHSSSEYALLCVAVPEMVYLLMLGFYRSQMFPHSRYRALAWAFALLLPLIPVALSRLGVPVHIAICAAFIGPAAFVWLNGYDGAVEKKFDAAEQ